ncbi:MAG: hypothetical protein NTV02_00280 [Candidatus Zambryskibacteria bacterium]|nr:hypothetical protein [Candidatus Zambryskibacteria bacterium]
MEPKFQTSFIPKSPIASANSASFAKTNSFSIVGTIGTVFFILALLVSGLVFGYGYYLKTQLNTAKQALVEARGAFDSPENKKIILASNQIKSIQMLLDSHTVVSPLFKLLEEQTLPTVRLTSFEFSRGSKASVSVSIDVEAQSYASLAQQLKIFSELKYLKNVTFDGIDLLDSGAVETVFTADVDAEFLVYSKKLQTVSMTSTTQ